MSSSHDLEWGPRPLCGLTCARTGSVEFVAVMSEFVVAITVMPPRAPNGSMSLQSGRVLSHLRLQISDLAGVEWESVARVGCREERAVPSLLDGCTVCDTRRQTRSVERAAGLDYGVCEFEMRWRRLVATCGRDDDAGRRSEPA